MFKITTYKNHSFGCVPIIQVNLPDGRRLRIRRDQVEIYGSRAFLPRWLADRIMKKPALERR